MVVLFECDQFWWLNTCEFKTKGKRVVLKPAKPKSSVGDTKLE